MSSEYIILKKFFWKHNSVKKLNIVTGCVEIMFLRS